MRTTLRRSGIALLAAVGLATADTQPRFAGVQRHAYGSGSNHNLLRTDSKTLWSLSTVGLVRLREGDTAWFHVGNSPLLSDLPEASSLAGVDTSKNLWIAGPVGVQRIDPNGEWTTWRFADGLLPGGTNRSLSIDGNKVYLLRDSARALRFSEGKWDTLTLTNATAKHPITQLAVIRDTLWTASSDTTNWKSVERLPKDSSIWQTWQLPTGGTGDNQHRFMVLGDTLVVSSWFSGTMGGNPGDQLSYWYPGARHFTALYNDGESGFASSLQRIPGGFLITRGRYLLTWPGSVSGKFDTLSNFVGNPFPNSGYRIASFVSADGQLYAVTGKKPAIKGHAVLDNGLLLEVKLSGTWPALGNLADKDHEELTGSGRLQFRPDGTGMISGYKGLYALSSGGDSLTRWDSRTWSAARPIPYDFVTDTAAVTLAGKDSVILLRKGNPSLLPSSRTKDSTSGFIAGLPMAGQPALLFTNYIKDMVTYDGVWAKSLLAPKGYYRDVQHAGSSIWIRTDSAVYRWKPDGTLNQPVGTFPASLSSLSPVDDSTAWVGGTGGLWKVTLTGNGLVAALVHATSKSHYAVLGRSRDEVWAGVGADTLVRFSANDSSVYTAANFPLPAGGFTQLALDSNDGLWIHTGNFTRGLVRVDLKTWFPPVQVGIGSARSAAQGLTASLRRNAVAFRTTVAGAARLEVLDASGRQVAVRDLGTLAAGSHEVSLPEGKGLRLVRLSTAQGSRTFRAAGF